MSPPTDVEAARATAKETGRPVFISVVTDGPDVGIPFAVKDNIDVAGVATTAGCPDLSRPADASATVVTRLEAAGHVPVAKTNLDQFATGLVGTRSPYGACTSVFDTSRVSGGSSSGSAVAVARGIVPLALGTDTAGSGRIPAAFNGLVGVKPTRGLVPTRGVFPACRSLDCVTTLTRTVGEARTALTAIAGYDAADPWSRQKPPSPQGVAATFTTVGIPDGPIDLDPGYRVAYEASVGRARALGLRVVPVDVSAFLEAAQLLYSGPWVAERYAAFGHHLDSESADPTVRQIVLGGRGMSAVAAVEAYVRLAVLRRRSEGVWARVDALLLPVAPTHPTLAAVAADPVGVNSRLGTFTNFVNLLDLCAVAVPGGPTVDGLPFGVQVIAPAFADDPLLDLAARWTGEPEGAVPARTATAQLVLVGAHMSGLPLNHLVAGRGGRLLRRARTSGGYRMVRVPGPGIPRPALIAGAGPAAGFAVEVWEIPLQTLGSLAGELVAPLRFGQLTLDDGTRVLGYVGDDTALGSADSLDAYDGWRDYLGASSV